MPDAWACPLNGRRAVPTAAEPSSRPFGSAHGPVAFFGRFCLRPYFH
jgi:hypothetical protein